MLLASSGLWFFWLQWPWVTPGAEQCRASFDQFVCVSRVTLMPFIRQTSCHPSKHCWDLIVMWLLSRNSLLPLSRSERWIQKYNINWAIRNVIHIAWPHMCLSEISSQMGPLASHWQLKHHLGSYHNSSIKITSLFSVSWIFMNQNKQNKLP